MDVLQILGTMAQQKTAKGELLPADDVNWEEFLNATPELLSPDISVAEAENPEQTEIVEDVQAASETDDVQAELPLIADTAEKSEVPSAVSVQEFSTTLEHNTSALLSSSQEKTHDQSVSLAPGAFEASKEATVFPAYQAASLPQEPVKFTLPEGIAARRLEKPQALHQATVKNSEAPPKEASQYVRSLAMAETSDIADLETHTKDAKIRMQRAGLPELMGQTQNALTVAPKTEGKFPEQHVMIEQVQPREVEAKSADAPRLMGMDVKDTLMVDRSPQNLTALDPRVLQSESPVRFVDVGISQVSNLQPTTPSSSSAAVAIANAPLRDQPVLLQISQAIDSAETGKIELRLDPAELGKVRITMTARDGLMHATITAERPETLDLLRRNSESLDMTFAEQGFGQNELSFEQFDQGDQSETPTEDEPRMESVEFSAEQAPRTMLAQVADGLDIKL